jgi:undecaprenyl-diphosphatase
MKLRNVIVGTVLVGAALKIGRWSSTDEGRGVDAELFGELNRGHGPEADRFFTGVTELGSIWAAGAAAGILALTGRRRAAANAFAAAGAAWLAGQGLKKVAHRPRPYDADADGTRLLVGRPNATSWPSSHPAVLTAFTRVAARDLALGPISRVGLTGLDLSVAASRVYVGVHYPSDVVSGLLIGRTIGRLWPARRSSPADHRRPPTPPSTRPPRCCLPLLARVRRLARLTGSGRRRVRHLAARPGDRDRIRIGAGPGADRCGGRHTRASARCCSALIGDPRLRTRT